MALRPSRCPRRELDFAPTGRYGRLRHGRTDGGIHLRDRRGACAAHQAFKPQLFEVKVGLTTFIQPTNASLNTADLKNATLVFTILWGGDGTGDGNCRRPCCTLDRGAVIVGLGGMVAVVSLGGSIVRSASSFLSPLVPDPTICYRRSLSRRHLDGHRCRRRLGVRHRNELRSRHPQRRDGRNVWRLRCDKFLFHGISEALFPDSGSTSRPIAYFASVALMAIFLVTVLIACGTAWGALGRGSLSRVRVLSGKAVYSRVLWCFAFPRAISARPREPHGVDDRCEPLAYVSRLRGRHLPPRWRRGLRPSTSRSIRR